MTTDFAEFTESPFLETLPSNVRQTIANLEKAGADWDTIGAMLSNTPALGVALKGVNWKQTLWQACKAEFHSLLCTDSPAYKDLRDRWEVITKDGPNVVVASLAGAVGAQLGMAPGVLAPIVVWLCVVSARMGRNVLCATLLSIPAQDKTPPTPPAG
jgi:hypothetical protein